MSAATPLFDRWARFQPLWRASLRAARGKRRRPSVARVLLELEPTLLVLERALLAGSYRPGAAQERVVMDGKRRVIHVAPFVDRVVHQALCHAIGPLLDRGLIERSYACRVGKGTHAALRQARLWARHYRWFVHLDVRKFFPSIDHAILLAQLRRDLPCARTLDVCARILEAGARELAPMRLHFPGDDLFTPLQRAVGLPIGNLTSQHFANRYLSPVDHRATDRLRVHAYLRYMDDFLLFDDDPARLRDHASAVEAACHRQRLRLHPWSIQPTRAGVTFVGFRILPTEIRVKGTTVRRALRRLRKLAEEARGTGDHAALLASLRATFAHLRHGDTFRLREQMLRALALHADDYEPGLDEGPAGSVDSTIAIDEDE